MLDDLKDIWIYRLKAGKIIEIPAFIFVNSIPGITTISAYDRDNKNYLMQIPNGEGHLFCNNVWYSEPNFAKAKDAFLYELESRISEHYSKAEELTKIAGKLYKQEGVE